MTRTKNITIVAMTHGHETLGADVHAALRETSAATENLSYIIGNPQAYRQGVAFIDDDLNRVFPGRADGNYEQRRAHELLPQLRNSDIVIDIHATTTITDPHREGMIIITKPNRFLRRLVGIIRPPRVLLMRYKSEGALISAARNGLAFEYGANGDTRARNMALHDIGETLRFCGAVQHNPFESYAYAAPRTIVYDVQDVYKKCCHAAELDGAVRNFATVRRGAIVSRCPHHGEDRAAQTFIPILFGENRYREYFGFIAKIVSWTQ